jgi:hypothetical protein
MVVAMITLQMFAGGAIKITARDIEKQRRVQKVVRVYNIWRKSCIFDNSKRYQIKAEATAPIMSTNTTSSSPSTQVFSVFIVTWEVGW